MEGRHRRDGHPGVKAATGQPRDGAAGRRHDHGHRAHGAPVLRAGEALQGALWWTLAVVGVEIAGALLARSLALAADAGHMLTDVGGMGLAAWASRVASRPPTGTKTYGFGRAGVLAGLCNAALLMAVAVGIAVAAVLRLLRPHHVQPPAMLAAAAAVALGINLYVATRLRPHAHGDLNVKSARLHVLGDAGGSLAVLLAAAAIAVTGRAFIDPALSLGLAAIVGASAWRMVAAATHVLLEGAPEGLDATVVASVMAGVPGVRGVHHVHLWSIGGGRRALSGHLVLGPISLQDGQSIARATEQRLAERFRIEHCTLQIEVDGDCRACETDANASP